jgi:hypothetical protein
MLLSGSFTDQGVTASDNVDGTYKQGCSCRRCCKCKHSGTYVITYNVSDAAGNAAKQVTRSVTVAVDSVRPIITLIEFHF